MAGFGSQLYTGVVEDNKDPLKLGRCRVRVMGVHASDKTVLPTEDLPWASPMLPMSSAGVSGVGQTPVGLVTGSWVSVMFHDQAMQQPIIVGSIPGLNKSNTYSGTGISSSASEIKIGDVIDTVGGWKDGFSSNWWNDEIDEDDGDDDYSYLDSVKYYLLDKDFISDVLEPKNLSFDSTESLKKRPGYNNNIPFSTENSNIYSYKLSPTNENGAGVEIQVTDVNSSTTSKFFCSIKKTVDVDYNGRASSNLVKPDSYIESTITIKLDSEYKTFRLKIPIIDSLPFEQCKIMFVSQFTQYKSDSDKYYYWTYAVDRDKYLGKTLAQVWDGQSLKWVEPSLSNIQVTPEEPIPESKPITKLTNYTGTIKYIEKYQDKLDNLKSSLKNYGNEKFISYIDEYIDEQIMSLKSRPIESSLEDDIFYIKSEYVLLLSLLTKTNLPSDYSGATLVSKLPDSIMSDFIYHASAIGIGDVFSQLYNQKNPLLGDLDSIGSEVYATAKQTDVNHLLKDIESSIEFVSDNVSSVISSSIITPIVSTQAKVQTVIDTVKTAEETIETIATVISNPTTAISNLLNGSIEDVIGRLIGGMSFIDDVFDWLGTSMSSVLDGYDSVANAFGFSSPFGKWPLKNRKDEPDTNRLARGETSDTILEYVEKKRKTGIDTAFGGGGSWDEPEINFGGEYPYCQVTESESGHVIIQDDTPDKESKMTYHRAGSYDYTDYKGAKTNKIVGSNYTVIDKNGKIYIEGACTVTVGKDTLLLVEKNLMIEVKGETVLKSENVYIN